MSYRPRFAITPALLARVEVVAALRERIQGAAVQVAWIPALQKDTRARNAHSSTAIEGNPLTLEQVRAVEAGEALAVPARARREVVNYFAALRHIEKQAAKGRVEQEDVLRLHRIVAAIYDRPASDTASPHGAITSVHPMFISPSLSTAAGTAKE